MPISMILIHIIRRKKKNSLPTHIKHNSSKIITIIITIMYTIESITWTFCTISFKLAIGPNISKEFLRSIALFSVQFQGTCDRSVQIFKGIARSVRLKGYYCLISEKVAINQSKFSKEFGDRST
jgi:hypothetical protein